MVSISVTVALVLAQPPPPPAPPFGCNCETMSVVLTGAAQTAQSSRAGDYIQMDGVTRYGRAVYQQSGGSQYLYFWEGSSDWYVGPDYTSGSAWLISVDNLDAQCPEAAGTWWYYNGSAWESGGVAIRCACNYNQCGRCVPLDSPPGSYCKCSSTYSACTNNDETKYCSASANSFTGSVSCDPTAQPPYTLGWSH